MAIGVGLLGLGTVGAGVAAILMGPGGRHPLVGELALRKVAVRDPARARPLDLDPQLLTTSPEDVIDDPAVEIVVEVMGGLEPARSLILRAIAAGKPVVTANKAVIARHGEEIAAAAAERGVYVLIEAAVGGGIPIIEPLKQSLGGNRIQRVSGIINGTTNYILSRMADEGAAYAEVLADAQRLGYAEADPAADVQGGDAADKIAILAGLAYGGPVPRAGIATEGIDRLDARDVAYAAQLGFVVKLVATAERLGDGLGAPGEAIPLDVRVHPTLLPKSHPLAGVHGVNNAILVEGDPVGRVMFYGPGAGAGPTALVVEAVPVGGVVGIAPLVAVGLLARGRRLGRGGRRRQKHGAGHDGRAEHGSHHRIAPLNLPDGDQARSPRSTIDRRQDRSSRKNRQGRRGGEASAASLSRGKTSGGLFPRPFSGRVPAAAPRRVRGPTPP